jgi:signal transduction histidine kinase
MCDATRIVQVLTNLCSNGLQYFPLPRRAMLHCVRLTERGLCRYTPAKGTVELRLEVVDVALPLSPDASDCVLELPSKVTVRFSVNDDGKGMSAAEVPLLLSQCLLPPPPPPLILPFLAP